MYSTLQGRESWDSVISGIEDTVSELIETFRVNMIGKLVLMAVNIGQNLFHSNR